MIGGVDRPDKAIVTPSDRRHGIWVRHPTESRIGRVSYDLPSLARTVLWEETSSGELDVPSAGWTEEPMFEIVRLENRAPRPWFEEAHRGDRAMRDLIQMLYPDLGVGDSYGGSRRYLASYAHTVAEPERS